jgi:AraC family transcriptional regulator
MNGMPAFKRPAAETELARKVLPCSRWYQTFPSPAYSASICRKHATILLNHYTGIPPEMLQPALKDHVIAIHLGGPKRVHRWHAGRHSVQDVSLGSLTIMPARQENRWLTEGPVEFAHLTLDCGFLYQIAIEEFDNEPAACELIDSVGAQNAMIEQLFRALLQLESQNLEGRLYPDSLLTVLAVALLCEHSTFNSRARSKGELPSRLARKGGLAGWQLRRVVDYMAEFMATDIALADLTRLTGLSRAQFFRAFKQSTGLSPHRFLIRMRIDHARVLLETSDLSITEVSRAAGFVKTRCFTAAFAEHIGMPPRLFRKSRE